MTSSSAACCSTTGRPPAGTFTPSSEPSPSAGCATSDRNHLGQQIIDHFSQRPHNPYGQAGTLEDLRDAITVVRTLFQIGRKPQAWDLLRGDLMNALLFNVEAYPECLSLLRPFFPYGWSAPAEGVTENDLGSLASNAAIAFSGLGAFMQSAELSLVVVRTGVKIQTWHSVRVGLSNLRKIFTA